MKFIRISVSIVFLMIHILSFAYWDSVDEEKIIDFADSLFSSRDYAGALTEYKRFLFLYPTSSEADKALFRIGACYKNLGEFHQAIEVYETHLRRYPGSPLNLRVRLNMAECYLLNDDREESRRRFEMLIASGDQDIAIRSRFLLGLMEVESGNWRESARWFNSISGMYPLSDKSRLANQMAELARMGESAQRRSPTKAALLSALIPGTGQIYSGDVTSGLKIAALTVFSAVLTAHLADDGRTALAWHVGLLSGGLYLWNVIDARSSTQKANERIKNSIIDRMRRAIEESWNL